MTQSTRTTKLLLRAGLAMSLAFLGGCEDDSGQSSSSGPWEGPSEAPAGSPVATHGQLAVVGTQLQDSSGAVVDLKGVSSMWLNWETMGYPESKSALQFMRDKWKLSVIRAAMGTDSNGGYLNGAKLLMQGKVEAIVQHAIELGVYVIIDWHTENAVSQTADAVAFFTKMARKYGGYPNVIYEPYNEPTHVTWADIKPYHEAVVAAIRAEDPDNLIVLGTPTYSQDVNVAANDPVAGDNLLYTLHFYSCTHKQTLRDKADAAIAKGIGLFITEFGLTPADGGTVANGDNNVCEDEANNWFSWMADNHVSGVGWKLDSGTDSSCILTPKATLGGPWSDSVLTTHVGGTPVAGGVKGGGHGLLVVDWIRQ